MTNALATIESQIETLRSFPARSPAARAASIEKLERQAAALREGENHHAAAS